jgi:hypothetical protein
VAVIQLGFSCLKPISALLFTNANETMDAVIAALEEQGVASEISAPATSASTRNRGCRSRWMRRHL